MQRPDRHYRGACLQFQIDASERASRAGEAVAAARMMSKTETRPGSRAELNSYYSSDSSTGINLLCRCYSIVFRFRDIAAGCRLLTSCPVRDELVTVVNARVDHFQNQCATSVHDIKERL